MKNESLHFAVCISNADYPASLESGKIYGWIPDENAETHGYLRVIDESGEDYAYRKDCFFPIEFPAALQDALFKAA